jgi:hypothetical protein
LPKFIIPCVISLIISCLYNIVDQIFVGNGIGYLGNAATGIIFPITVVGWGLSLLFGAGAAAYLSLSQGSGNTKHLGETIANSIYNHKRHEEHKGRRVGGQLSYPVFQQFFLFFRNRLASFVSSTFPQFHSGKVP